MPGVVAVLTGADLTWCDPYFGPAFRDRPILAIDVVRYEGEPVAAVAAVDEATAARRSSLIDVDYEPLPAVTTLEEALAPGAPLVHTGQPPGRPLRRSLHASGPGPARTSAISSSSRAATRRRRFAGADVVVEDTLPLPARAALRAWSPTPRGRVGRDRAASPSGPRPRIRTRCASSSRGCSTLPLARIRIVVPHLGGGFGSKTYAKLEPLAATRSRAWPAGRCGWRHRAPRRFQHRAPLRLARHACAPDSGATARSSAVECHADFDVGAYADIGPRVVQKGTYTATGPYRVPHVRLEARAVYTNTTPGGAFRGFGVPQLAWALESLVDVAADRLDRDPVDLRRQNLLAHGEEFAPGDTPIDGKLEESLARAAEAIGWTQAAGADRGRGRGGDDEGLDRAERVGGDRAAARRRQRRPCSRARSRWGRARARSLRRSRPRC